MCSGKTASNDVHIPSAVWSPDGLLIGAIINEFYPTIYSIDDPLPLCVLKSKSYSSVTTIKTGCFDRHSAFFASGSDDFCVYEWKLPDVQRAKLDREAILSEPTFGTENIKPMTIQEETYRFMKHRSIVNSVL